MKNKYVLGIDIGGMSVKIGLFDSDGKIVEKFIFETRKEKFGENILTDTAEHVLKILHKNKISTENVAGAGIAVPGPVEKGSTAAECVNLGWRRKNVKYIFESLTSIKTVVINDANSAAMGEFYCGSGKKYSTMVFVTIGTGVGGGIIYNGKIINGVNGVAGEIGHITVNRHESEKCNCGKCGCLEQYSSATGMKKYALKLIKNGMKTALEENFEVKDIVDMAKNGDELCIDVVENMGMYMGIALADITCVLDPEIIVIGGGVSAGGNIITDTITKHYKKYAFGETKNTPIVVAELGNEAGIYGAAKAAKYKEEM